MTTDSNSENTPPDAADAFLFAVDALKELQSAQAGLAAMEMSLYATIVARAEEVAAGSPHEIADQEMAIRSACAEIGATLRVHSRTIQSRVSDSYAIVHGLPLTFEALRSGRIAAAHAREILAASVSVPGGEPRQAYEEIALDRATQMSPASLKAILPSIAAQISGASLTERHQQARKNRCIHIRDLDDGMSELRAFLPSVLAHGVHDRLTAMAKAVEIRNGRDGANGAGVSTDGSVHSAFGTHSPASGAAPYCPALGDAIDGSSSGTASHDLGSEISLDIPVVNGSLRDQRGRDEIRADIFTDLLLGGGPIAAGDGLDAITAHVQITVPVLTAAGVSDTGTELIGSGPMDAATARRLLGAASGWDRVMTHPVTGAILAVDRYRPSQELRRILRVRDEHCRFPGCRQPAHRCDADHSLAAAHGGETSLDNLALV